jgi:hypothetical protein
MTTKTILGNTVYGDPSGNYDGSSQDWSSDPVTAANYYRGRGGVQTITFGVSGFEGIMYLEACLDENPAEANWFTTYIYGDGSTIPLTDFHPATITGNFSWMRVRVAGFSGGTIDSVTITY